MINLNIFFVKKDIKKGEFSSNFLSRIGKNNIYLKKNI